jgi:hypothetical protein
VGIGQRERIITAEGELGFWVPTAGELLGAPAHRYIGVVYGDDFANLLDLQVTDLAAAPRLAMVSRELVRDTSLGLGVRRRRFGFIPPPGWHAHAIGLAAHYYSPEFPSRPATLVVYPANPTGHPPNVVFDSLLHHEETRGFTLTGMSGPRPVEAAGVGVGKHWQLEGKVAAKQLTRDVVVFVEPPYSYSLVLDTVPSADVAAARSAFFAVVASVERVPAPGLRQIVPPPPGSLDLFTSDS